MAFILYGNSINNEYALDDNIVVEANVKVEKGFSGIKDIFTTHYAADKEQRYGYRPVVLLTFAIENELFGFLKPSQAIAQKERKDVLTRANVSHFFNVCLYALTCVLLFYFLTLLLSEYNVLPSLLITLLFLVHPLHTEPVCNIKSRDELLMLFFILSALIFYLKFIDLKQMKHIVFAILFSLIAILSKKSAIAMVGILPVVLYFKGVKIKQLITLSLLTIIPLAIFTLMKKGLISEPSNRVVEFYENPLRYMEGQGSRVTLALSSALFYLKMLIFPKDLSFYYGYNQVEIPNWGNYKVWLGILFFIPTGVYGVVKFLKRDLIGLGIVLWFGVMLGVINLIFPIVGIVADRFAYVFSIGFCIAFVALVLKLFKIDITKEQYKIKLPIGFVILVGGIILLSSFRTLKRNSDWENYITLFRHDNEHLQQSAKANAILGDFLYRRLPLEQNAQRRLNLFNEMEIHYLRAISIYPAYFSPHNNLGTAYFTYKNDLEGAKKHFLKALDIDSTSTITIYNLARTYELLNEIENAGKYYKKLTIVSLSNKEDIGIVKSSYSYSGLMYVKANDIKNAFITYKNAVEEFPNEPEYNLNLANLYLAEYDTITALNYYEKGFQLNPSNKKVAIYLSKLFQKMDNTDKFNYYQSMSR